jgi:glycosyltransferase involved in cell wall biosynthesis
MDFNPDEAIAAGWLRPHSPVARVLDWISRFSLRQARKILALDRFMRERIVAKGIAPAKVLVIPPWSHDTEVTFDAEGRERFRKAHGLDGKFVVMYSGNHSPVHPLDTLLAAARQLASNPDVTFCFIGGGSEWRKIQEKQKTDRTLSNIICLPYQPLDQLAGSLSAADLHVVVMGNDFVGLVHPCKIYNALSVGAPVLYIGPSPSHISEILDTLDGHYTCAAAHHGDVERVVEQILRVRRESAALVRQPPKISSMFSRETLLPRLVAELEGQ